MSEIPTKSAGDVPEGTEGTAVSRARARWLTAAVVLFGFSSFVAFIQTPRPHPGKKVEVFNWDWWRYPRESNAFLLLQEITVDLNDIYALPGDGPGKEKVWAVGNGGLIVRSVDGGRTWVKGVKGGLGEGGAPTGEQADLTGNAGTATGRATLQFPSLISLAYAAEEPPQEPDGLAEVDGLVLDPKGVPLPKAFVEITEGKRGRLVAPLKSDDKGRFQLPLRPGQYLFTVFHPSYGREKFLRELTPGRASVELKLTAPQAGEEEAETGKSPLAIPQTPVQAAPDKEARAPKREPKQPPEPTAKEPSIPIQQVPAEVPGVKTPHGTGPGTSVVGPTANVPKTVASVQKRKQPPDPTADGGKPAKGAIRGEDTSEKPGDFSEDLVSVYFSSEEEGWAVARSGKFLYTTDAGQHWMLGGEGSRSGEPARASRPNDSAFGWFKGPSGQLTTVHLPAGEISYPDGVSFEVAQQANAAQLAKAHIVLIAWGAEEDTPPLANRILGWGVTSEGTVSAFLDQQDPFNGQTVSPPEAGLAARGLWVSDPETFWVGGEDGAIFRGNRGQLTAGQRGLVTQSTLHAIYFLPDSQRGWIAGADGTILHTTDGGETWFHQTLGSFDWSDSAEGPVEYSRSLPPWYFLSWLVVGLLLAPALRKEKPLETEQPSIADKLVSDRPIDPGDADEPQRLSVSDALVSDRPLEPGDPDPVGLRFIAGGLSRFLRNEKTEPPVTIAVTGEWGTGKSSLMNLVRGDLKDAGLRTVWFNAWHHQKDRYLLASLLQNVRFQAAQPWWHPEEWAFRARLIWIRGWRSWLPVMLLLGLSSVLAGLLYSAEDDIDALQHFAHMVMPSSERESAQESGAASHKEDALLLYWLFSVLGTVFTAYRKLSSFVANPATLLARQSGRSSVRDLDAQTSFRQKFAKEFREVVDALGSHRLVVFIDDLDRCEPDNVVETLEAVNYLVTSGRCFVVLGCDRTYVRRCVGLSFARVALEMVDEPDGPDGDVPRRERSKKQREEFARQYLEKLINIEAPIPKPTQQQSHDLLTRSSSDAKLPERKSEKIGRVLRATGKVLFVGFVALSLYKAFDWGQGLRPTESQSPDPSGDVILGAAEPLALEGQGSDKQGAEPPGKGSTPAPDEAKVEPPEVRDARAEVDESEPSYWPMLAVLPFLMFAFFWLLTRRVDLVVKDSPEFTEVLAMWHPVVVSRQNTPRSVKRYLNRVRFLAERQRPFKPALSPWKRFLRKVDNMLGDEVDEQVAAPTTAPIPESALVAMAAIQQFDPRFLEDKSIWARFALNSLVEVRDLTDDQRNLLGQAYDRHVDRFGVMPFTDPHRKAFLEMSTGVRVS